MPWRMWQVDFKCPHCAVSLRLKGNYRHIRKVLDIKDYYYLAAEYMECYKCKGTYIAWDDRMLGQLADGVRVQFPVTLTYRYACDISFSEHEHLEAALLLSAIISWRFAVKSG